MLRFARPLALNAWVNASRVRAKIAQRRGDTSDFWTDVHAWLDANAFGRSFIDIGTMWSDTWGAFDAADRGAEPVAALDVTAPTEACRAEQARRGLHDVRFITGDLHDPDVIQEIGVYDVVLCSGVLYHSPNPCLTLERLHNITGDYLLLSSNVIQEVPGIPNACVFYPGLTEEQRLAFAAPFDGIADGLTTPFDPALDYSNWWWGISRSALRGMLTATGWDIVEERVYHAPPGYRTFTVARPSKSGAELMTTPMAKGATA